MLLASNEYTFALESAAAALRTKDNFELTWDYVAVTLIDEYNAISVSKNSSETKINAKGPANESQGHSQQRVLLLMMP